MTEYVTEKENRKQAWKYYFLAAVWPVYVFLLPAVYVKFGLLAAFFVVFPGVYLYTWMSCLMHECWHKYVPNIANDAFYNLFSYMLMTDPQIYRILHGHHHSQVNTWDDVEFHPLGEIKKCQSTKNIQLP